MYYIPLVNFKILFKFFVVCMHANLCTSMKSADLMYLNYVCAVRWFLKWRRIYGIVVLAFSQ